jgi:hypothetical protein
MRSARPHGASFLRTAAGATVLLLAGFAPVRRDSPPTLATVHVESPTSTIGRPPPRASPMPGPAIGPRTHDPVIENAACEGCHMEIAKEWRASLHRHAYVDPVFARAFAREPDPFCQSCHAPDADPLTPVPPAIADLGVSCVSCHRVEDVVLAGTGGTAEAPHALLRSASFETPAACAGCHEFDFPGRRGEPMQLTVREHASSRFATTSCSECHMPMVEDASGRHRSHRFAASSDSAMLRRAVDVQARRIDPTTIEVVLAPALVGHAFPTGDLFRRLAVEAEVVDEDGDMVAGDVQWLGRRFADERKSGTHALRRMIADERVGARGEQPVLVHLELGLGAAGRRVTWRVMYERVELPDPEGEDVIAERIEVTAGVLP